MIVRHPKRLILASLGFCSLSATGFAQQPQEKPDAKPSAQDLAPTIRTPFDDTKWVVELTPDKDSDKSGAKPLVDTLVLTGGKLFSKLSHKDGFGPATLAATQTAFSAESFTTDRRHKCEWRATLTADQLVGTLVSARGDGTLVRYALLGSRALALDGTRWSIQIRPALAEGVVKAKDDSKPEPVTEAILSFEHNKLTCDAPALKGSPQAAYRVTRAGDRMTLTADTAIAKDGRVAWLVDFDRDTLKGSARVTAKDGAPTTHSIEGKRQPDVVDAALPKLPEASQRESKDKR